MTEEPEEIQPAGDAGRAPREAAAVDASASPAEPAAPAAGEEAGLRGALDAEPPDYQQRALILAFLWVYTFGSYYLIGLTGDSGTARSLHTVVDDWIPFWPAAMWAYEGVYTALLYPLFTIRCQRLFRRTALGYFWVATVCSLIWLFYPVTAVGLRADVTQLDPTRFLEWGVRTNYALDPPLNCFPSLHLAITTLAALCALKARRLWGVLGLIGAAAVGYAICAVKQHFFLDGLAGAGLAFATWWVLVRPYDPGQSPVEEVAYSWRGPAIYAAVHLSVVLVFVVAFLVDWRAWELVGKG